MPQTFTQPHPNLWVAQSEVFATNSGIFFNDAAACLVDPAVLPEDLRGIQNLLNEKRLRPENLVITHYHWDHLFGPEAFPNVRVIAQQASQAVAAGPEAERVQENVKRFETEYRVRRSRPFRIPVAEISFESTMIVQLGDVQLQLIHSPGHSPDQSVIYQPEGGILWAADMLSDLEIPFIFYSLPAYQATLERLRLLEVSLLIPGHGRLTQDATEIRARMDEDIAYLAELHGRVTQGLQAGHTLEETQAACAGMAYRRPEDNIGPHNLNVENAYTQLMAAG